MRAGLSVLLVTALVMVVTSLLTPVAFAKDQQRDPNEGEPKHEINELQNRLHQTEDRSKQKRLEGKIDALQELRQDCEFPAQGVQLQRPVLFTNTPPEIVEVETDICGNAISYTEPTMRTLTASPWVPR